MFTVAPHYQIMVQLGLKDLSRNLHVNCTISFLFCLYLIFHVYVQIFDDIFNHKFLDLKWHEEHGSHGPQAPGMPKGRQQQCRPPTTLP